MSLISTTTGPALATSAIDESLAIDPTHSGAYQWWYFDATSDDQQETLVVIVFIGSVFSPWYFAGTQNGNVSQPQQHCAINVALSSKRSRAAKRWVFSEYQRFSGSINDGLTIGQSTLRKKQNEYILTLDDLQPYRAMPWKLRGEVKFVSNGSSALLTPTPYVLDDRQIHHWCPVAPRCRVEVELSAPNMRFSGTGYHDLNYGNEPLGAGFDRWHWARSHSATRSRIRYDRVLLDHSRHILELHESEGIVTQRQWKEPRPMPLQLGPWAMWEPSEPCVNDATRISVHERVESSPFYLRYAGRTSDGESAVGECLDLPRFAMPMMQKMLPFRARRV